MPWLVVDGYNVAHAWGAGRTPAALGPDAAAALLVDRLRVLHDGGELRVVVVFDGKGETVQAVQERGKTDVEILYSASSQSADAVIEQLVCRAEHPDEFVVATRDNMVQETVFALGASVMTPEKLLNWIEQEECKQTNALKLKQRESDCEFGNRLFG